MQTIVLASGNEGKVLQIKNFLSDKNINVNIKSMKDFNIKEPVEDGKSYLENALLKARNAFFKCNLPVLADDSGFNIFELNGFPGLVSGRFAEACGGYENTFKVFDKCLSQDRKASFCTAMAFIYRKNNIVVEKTFTGEIFGEFVFPPRGNNGFGYCSCFKPDGYDKTFAEFSDDVISKINHRAIALDKFAKFLKSENMW